MQLKEMQMLNELMRTGILDKTNFSTALQDLVEEKISDNDSFRRIRQLIEEHFDESKDEASRNYGNCIKRKKLKIPYRVNMKVRLALIELSKL